MVLIFFFCFALVLSSKGSIPRLGGLVALGLGRHAGSTCRECLLEQIAHHNIKKQRRKKELARVPLFPSEVSPQGSKDVPKALPSEGSQHPQ